MLSYLEGKVILSNQDGILVVNQGLGYTVQTIEEFLINEEISLYIYSVIKEDSISFIGFTKQSQITLFKSLLSVTGIGPATALTIMKNTPISTFVTAVLNKDTSLLSSFKGVSNKNALNIINFIKLPESLLTDLPQNEEIVTNNDKKYAIDSLVALGYDSDKAKSAVESSFLELNTDEVDILSSLVTLAIGKL
jgi:Holliday junction DNA helicase RuvA